MYGKNSYHRFSKQNYQILISILHYRKYLSLSHDRHEWAESSRYPSPCLLSLNHLGPSDSSPSSLSALYHDRQLESTLRLASQYFCPIETLAFTKIAHTTILFSQCHLKVHLAGTNFRLAERTQSYQEMLRQLRFEAVYLAFLPLRPHLLMKVLHLIESLLSQDCELRLRIPA